MLDSPLIELWIAPEPSVYSQADTACWAGWMSKAEAKRMTRFVHEEDQQRFMLARALTRSVLGQYLNLDPAELSFTQNAYGKPMLAEELDPVSFNLSHTKGMLVLAVSRQVALGVDVEDLTRKVEVLALAQRYFSSHEIKALKALKGDEQRELFFAIWTLKEAWLKAKGLGLRVPLDAFSYAIRNLGTANESIALSCEASLKENVDNWSLARFQQGDFRIALASKLTASKAPKLVLRQAQKLLAS